MKTTLVDWKRNRLAWLENEHFVPRLTCWVKLDDGRELVATYEDGMWVDGRGDCLDNVREWQPHAIESVHI